MSVEYTKNLYKQNLSFANYVQILEESRTKVISMDLINTIISYINEDKDQKRTLECLEIFYNSIIKNLEWADVFHKSDFLDIVVNNRIEYESYILFKKILLFYKMNSYIIVFNRKRFDLCFLKKHFYNYAIYKEYFDSSTFDNTININNMNTIQIIIFKNILKDICLKNRDCDELKDYLNSLSLDIDFLKAVVDRNRIVDITCIPNEHIFDLYPYQIGNISNVLLSKFYLCSLSTPCKFCGEETLSYNYDEDIMKRIVQEETKKVKLECLNQIENMTNQKHRRFVEMRSNTFYRNELTNSINEADFIDLAYFINHKVIKINSSLIKTLLRASKQIKDNDHIIKCFSCIDVSVPEYENIILHYVKNLTENITTKIVLNDIKLFLRIYDSLNFNDKFSYALFVLLYQFFKEIKHTRYQRDYVLNEVYKRKSKIMKVIKLILEHHIIKSIDCVSKCFEENFLDLCYFLSEDNCGKFLEEHMHYIYPIIYSKEEFAIFVDNSQFNDKYFHFILINYILSGRIETVKELFVQNEKNSEYTIETIVYLLLTGYYDLSVFKTIYINWDTIIETNIIRILFELRKKYYEHFEHISICIFNILRNLLMILKDRPDIGNRIYPFIESFLSKGCRNCQNMCLELFIQFFTSCFSGILTSNITRLQMMLGFEDFLKNIRNLPMKVGLEHVYCFLTSKGYLKKHLSQKAFVLFKGIFQEEGNKSDEIIIKNFMKSFMGDLEVNRILSKMYDKIEDENFIKLLGFISNKFLYKETKRRLKSDSILKDNLKDIANISIEKYVMNVDIEDQDLYCFIIQELIRYSESPNLLPNHLLNSNYTMSYKYNPTNHHREVFKKSYGYEEFLDSLFIHLLFSVKEIGNEEYYEFFKYSNLLGTKYLEYSIYQLFHIVSKSNDMKTMQLLDNIFSLDGLNYNVVKFLVNLDIYTNNRYFDMKTVLDKSLLISDYHYCIFLIEKNIRQTDDRNLYNNLQYFYYKIGDYIKTRAINIKFSRVNSTNLFFEFILDRSLEAAKDCLIKVIEEDGSMAPYLTDILNENDDDSFIKQCSMVADDLSEWKNVHSKNRLCLHFLKDCEMIEKSKDLNETLKAITERRILSGDDLLLIKCHYYLIKAIENSHKNETTEITNQCENTLDTFGGSGIFSSIKQYDECDSIYDFEQELNYSHVKKLIEQEEFDKAIKIISSLLSKRNWGVLYEFSNLYIKQNKLNKSKECLKKVLSLFPKTSSIYQKAFVKYAELVDSKQIYEDALTDIKDSSYLYLLYAKNLEEENPIKSIELYISSILISDEHKYETIPKMLHILSELNDKKNIKTGVKLMNNIVEKEIKIFLPFFSQIITRLNHKNKEMADLVENIVLRLMDSYQNETHWKAILLMNSNESEIKERTKNIIQRLSLDKKIYLSSTKKFSEVLSTLASCNDKEICIEKSFPDIYTVINNGNITVPNTSIKIEGVDKNVEVFTSLQAPKKISFIGSDGRTYRWLCKYRDDLRKDSRFMELNCLINSLFSKNKFNYYIRTYEVIPFSHNYGIIEFIDGLASLKSICNDLYQRENISISNITKKYAKTKKIKAQNYKEVTNMFPPRFYKWFEENFSIPYNWFVARDNYTKTCAVMNIMGWFMGLGDRHADNILFDVNVGDTVHVDLNSIFESSKKLSIPERVPFRLTQNIVDAFGVLGLEGTYSDTMNETLDLFLKNRNLIISNLLSFVYDPLHEWRIRKEKAPKIVLEVLEKKLSPTDVTLKVENLNEEAMSITNLCEMYIGWLPFI